MEENKQEVEGALALAIEDAACVAGGNCDATVTLGSNGVDVTSKGDTVGAALIGMYDGLVDATSHVIETVANSVK